MASNTVNLNTYKAMLLAKTLSIIVGATGKTFDEQYEGGGIRYGE